MATAVDRAIAQSIQQNEIVTLKGYTADTSEWLGVVNGLAALASDWVEANASDEGVCKREYWGTDDEGDDWRVHVLYRVPAGA